jgi:hypothetical protein
MRRITTRARGGRQPSAYRRTNRSDNHATVRRQPSPCRMFRPVVPRIPVFLICRRMSVRRRGQPRHFHQDHRDHRRNHSILLLGPALMMRMSRRRSPIPDTRKTIGLDELESRETISRVNTPHALKSDGLRCTRCSRQ